MGIRFLQIVVTVILAAVATGCASSKTTVKQGEAPAHEVSVVALTGGMFADAVAIELLDYGLKVIDSGTASQLFTRIGVTEVQVEVASAETLAKLKAEGIDALITVKGIADWEGRPGSASARATSTHTGELIAGVTWQNGWGGQQGSIADRSMKKGLPEGAAEVAEALATALGRADEKPKKKPRRPS